MAGSMGNVDKITITIPSDLKEQVLLLKEELHTSISSIYKEAIESYLKEKELQKWKKAADLASKDKEYMKFIQEMDSSVDDIYEY
ncbi:ribbon-helix-helix domain-containing protein [Sulfurimonas sp.]|nr:ribbon-helix-helix domain-containing protein [Sulfurimonas sp.]